ncbi:glycosyltransferase [Niveibacterium sp. SC-1]|uniref:glycosyltransferase n=1 Tax=Niveibacterium sp. SC-1 TaxID=3135646 RepID=UPI00311D9141
MKRPVIGIPFNYDESWIGGSYYIKNLVSALNLLPNSTKPVVWMLSHGKDSYDFIKNATQYPRLNWIRPAFLSGIDGGASRRARLFSRLTPFLLKKRVSFDMVFPYPIDTGLRQTVCWIPDFQDKHLPELFSAEELAAREKQHVDYFTHYRHIVLSSHAAKADFEHYYPQAQVQKHVIPFAVFESETNQLDAEHVRKKLALPKRYFYCPNQFWIHKNHQLVIDAVRILKEAGRDVVVAFSGKEHDHRAPDHAENLKQQVRSHGLENNIRFLGFIPREEQMAVFSGATSVVQPSKFEGWSTVIEDAKLSSQYVLASRIPPNVEQITQNVEFFNPDDPNELASLLAKYSDADPACQPIDYRACQLRFAEAFMTVVRAVTADGKAV